VRISSLRPERIERVFIAGKNEGGFEDAGLSLDGDALGQDPYSSHEKKRFRLPLKF
jgi:hypothetical protein